MLTLRNMADRATRPWSWIFILLVGVVVAAIAAIDSFDSPKYQQLYVGFNAPEDQVGTTLMWTRQEASSSWVGKSLGADLDKVTASVDFEHQVLIAVATGKRSTTTRKVSIADVRLYGSSLEPHIQIGVTKNQQPCLGEKAPEKLFPFILAVVDRSHPIKVAGFDFQNYPDECEQTSR